MTTTAFTEHPPVPQVLQEALRDYPALIAELQEGLKTIGLRPEMSKAQRTDQLEAAIWMLEGDLEMFFSNAAQELRDAEATGDGPLIGKAMEKQMLLSRCCHQKSWVDDLMEFFRWGQD